MNAGGDARGSKRLRSYLWMGMSDDDDDDDDDQSVPYTYLGRQRKNNAAGGLGRGGACIGKVGFITARISSITKAKSRKVRRKT